MRTVRIVCLILGLLGAPAGLFAQVEADTTKSAALGEKLYGALRCEICHDVEARGLNVPPSLIDAGEKFQTGWLKDYMKAPTRRRWADDGVRPLERMPNYSLSEPELNALVAYLSNRTDSSRFADTIHSVTGGDSSKVARGRELYADYACNGCHVIDADGGKVGPELTHVGSRLRRKFLVVFLEDPQALIPGTAMKDFGLWDDEIELLVAYLASLREPDEK